MGCGSSVAAGSHPGAPATRSETFKTIRDDYETIEQVQEALRKAGLESSQLLLAVDCTKSNTWTGAQSFGGRCLHALIPGEPNPYQEAISIIGRTLSAFDDDGLIPFYGFGDTTTTDKGCFSFGSGPCHGFTEALERYNAQISTLTLSGPTSFAPVIDTAIRAVARTREYTILVIIADGQVSDGEVTEAAIVRASQYPISIVVVGVGDGPFGLMENWDDNLPARRFDNLQFVNFTRVRALHPEHKDATFAIHALQEIPQQYAAVQRLGLMRRPAGAAR
jgi:hypothetical protein